MQTQDQIIQQLQTDLASLLQSPPSYMRQITRVSQKVVSLQIKYIFFVLNKINQVIHDRTVGIKKKLFAFRFIKDTMLLASHSFYILVVVRILPFIVEILAEAQRQNDSGLAYLINKIGPKVQVSNTVEVNTFSTTLLKLLQQIMKWTGSHVKLHPFYTIPFSSIFKQYLDRFPKVRAIKMTDLTYFTTDSINTYEQNFLQRQLKSEQDRMVEANFIDLLVNNWISLPEDDLEKKGSLKLLQNIVETGDSHLIKNMVSCLKPLIESEITGFQAIQVVHAILKVKEIQSFTLLRDELLYSIAYYILMMAKQKFSQLQNINLIEILKLVFVWKINAVKIGLRTEAFDQFFRKMTIQKICTKQSDYTSNTNAIQKEFQNYEYFLTQDKVQTINEEKKKHLNLKDNQNALNKIRSLTYTKKNKSVHEGSYFHSEKSLPSVNQSFNKNQRLSFNPKDLKGSKDHIRQPLIQQPRVTFQTIQSQSPIKQLDIYQLQKSFESRDLVNGSKGNDDFIKFNNSLNNLSSSKELFKARREEKVENSSGNNIYTAKLIEEDKRSQSRSIRSIRSSRSSKKSMEKLEKASSLGLGVQKVKSSNFIHYEGDYNASSKHEPNQQKKQQSQSHKQMQRMNLLRFEESSEQIHQDNRISQKVSNSISDDNVPYKQDNEESVNKSKGNQMGYSQTGRSNYRRELRNQQTIIVQQTIRKPKFAFAAQVKKEKQPDKQSQDDSRFKTNHNKLSHNQNSFDDESFQSVQFYDPKIISGQKASDYSSVPSDFQAVFAKKSNHKHQKSNLQQSHSQSDSVIKFNKFPHKVKQLQMEIEKAKEYQRIYQEKMREKDEDYERILRSLPEGHEKVREENKRLERELEEKQRKQAHRQAMREQRMYRSPANSKLRSQQQIPFLGEKIFSIGKIKPYDPTFIKQVISAKCLLLKNEIFELGYAFKNNGQNELNQQRPREYWICLYFKFKVKCDKVEFKVVSESLILKDSLEGKVVNVVANKQLKFEQKVIGYSIKSDHFKIPYLDLTVTPQDNQFKHINSIRNKNHQPQLTPHYQITIPSTLINFLQFSTPKQKPQLIKTKYAIQPQFSANQLKSSLKGEYLLNSLRCGKWHQKQGETQGSVYVSLNTYLKGVRDPKIMKDKQIRVHFEQLALLQKKRVNLVIKKIHSNMFYIESDNQFQNDRIALVQISKILGRAIN